MAVEWEPVQVCVCVPFTLSPRCLARGRGSGDSGGRGCASFFVMQPKIRPRVPKAEVQDLGGRDDVVF